MYTLVSPWPPQRNGIADYAFEVARWTEPPLYVATEVANPERPATGRIVFVDPSRIDVGLPAVYHVGNNPDHAFLVPLFLRRPGIAVLHDLSLQYLAEKMEQRIPGFFAHLLRRGNMPLIERVWAEPRLKRGVDFHEVPMLDWLHTATALVVHSQHAARLVSAALPATPVHVVPHFTYLPDVGYAALQSLRTSVRDRWTGGDAEALVIAAVGFPRRHKQYAAVLHALSMLPDASRRRVLFLIGGEPAPRDYDLAADVARFGVDDRVRLLGYLPPRDMSDVMLAADIVLNLRYPSFGESSGVLSRALGLGCAVAVTQTGAYAELPDEICFKLPARADPSQALRTLFESLLADRTPIEAHRRAAYAYAHATGNPARIARRYVEIAGG